MSIVSLNFLTDDSSNAVLKDVNFFKFSGGEVHVQLKNTPKNVYEVEIQTRLKSSDDIMELLMVTNALRLHYGSKIPLTLVTPYLPYARQDKVSDDGESLSLKVFADLINNQNYNRIVTFDVHSDTSLALFDNIINIEQYQIASECIDELDDKINLDNLVLLSPDFGASKKIYKLASKLSLDVVQANKERDSSGHIIRTEVYRDDFNGKDVLIVDDICSGGRTFIEISKILSQRNVGKIYLYVTHGIFDIGIIPILDSGICKIITTNSFIENSNHERLHIIEIFN
jgi:ribose-phosphate pyrophosphokinase